MVDPRTSVDGIRDYIKEVDAKCVLTIDAAYSKIKQAVVGTNVRYIIVVSPADSLVGLKKALYKIKNGAFQDANDCILWDDFITQGKHNSIPTAEYKKDTCCVIVHTGGTTGTPKGVMLSNDNVNALVLQSILTEIDMKREHTWLDIMPPFIAYGIGMGLCLPLVIGMETILIPSFDASKFDELLLKHKPNHMVFVPSYWGTIIKSKKLKRKDLSFIIAPTVGGDTMDKELELSANRFLNVHGCAYTVTKGYGMTEICAGVTGTLDSNNEIGSVGVPFVKSIVSIFDPVNGQEMKYNDIGEICVSGPNLMLGYYGNQAATDEIMHPHEDGNLWLHSGDLGYMNENGSLFIIDRIKRIIVRFDGFKVFPSLLENAVFCHKAIEKCCAVGVKDAEHDQGQIPIVFIVLKDGFSAEKVKEELILLCKDKLAEYAQPKAFYFVPELPLTPIGKVDYRALEEIAKTTAGI